MNFKLFYFILVTFMIINGSSCKEQVHQSKMRDTFKDEFSFSSLKKELKYKYYLAMKKENPIISPIQNAMQLENERRIKTLKNIFNLVKDSIIS